jgi:hypothetical protein
MKLTVDIPLVEALKLKALAVRYKAGDPAVVAVVEQVAALGVDVTKIKLL